jgi:hypothetical protein
MGLVGLVVVGGGADASVASAPRPDVHPSARESSSTTTAKPSTTPAPDRVPAPPTTVSVSTQPTPGPDAQAQTQTSGATVTPSQAPSERCAPTANPRPRVEETPARKAKTSPPRTTPRSSKPNPPSRASGPVGAAQSENRARPQAAAPARRAGPSVPDGRLALGGLALLALVLAGASIVAYAARMPTEGREA